MWRGGGDGDRGTGDRWSCHKRHVDCTLQKPNHHSFMIRMYMYIDDVRLTLESEFAELDVDYGCSLEQSINEGHSSAHFSTSGEPETSQIIPFSAASPVPIEESASDVEEAQGIEQFIATTCKCQLGPSKQPCSLSFSKEAFQKCRNQCAELSHNELDLIVMAQVHYMRMVAPNDSSQQSSFRPVSTYSIHGIKVCQSTFLFMHNISRNRYIRITSKEAL